jgi:hypothetical protein
MSDGMVTFEPAADAVQLEKRGRAWLLWSFLLCPCHLPWTLAILATVFAGSSVGVVLREHAWIAGTLVTAAWVLGTGYGFRLVRRAERAGGACSTRTPKTKAIDAP